MRFMHQPENKQQLIASPYSLSWAYSATQEEMAEIRISPN